MRKKTSYMIDQVELLAGVLQSEKYKSTIIFLGKAYFVAILLWGIFFVPATILQESLSAQHLVEFTSSIFPWLDDTKDAYGIKAEKFVYMQCISIWLLLFPNAIFYLATATYPQLNKLSNGAGTYKFQAGLIVFLGSIFLNITVSTSYGPTKLERLYILNQYMSALGGEVLAILFTFSATEFVFASLYLLKYLREPKKYS